MNVEIFSDVVCPWCYLGQARFRKAVEEFGGEVDIVWKPFQLSPETPSPSSGSLIGPYLAEKFGGADKVEQAHSRLRALTGSEGLPFKPEITVHANSAKAHRVIALAGREGVQDAVVARLFLANHAEGRDIDDTATLVELAASAGLAAERVQVLLDSDEGVDELRTDLARARDLGISGVPFFLFEEKWAVSGGQPAEVFKAALEEVAANHPGR